MSTIDLSRQATDFRKHYAGVRMQQGRVLTDDDFNEAEALDAEGLRRTRVHAIGAWGTPDAGFLPKNFTVTAGRLDFSLTAGNAYLGGLHLELDADERFQLQKDWLDFTTATDAPAAPAAGQPRTDLVWIEAWQQPVTAIEDRELFEVALGGADTTTRWRTMRRVHVTTGVNETECASAWAQVSGALASTDGTIDAEMALTTTARLAVSFTAPASVGDLCSPALAGGYLGAENQAIRVQLVDATHYTWGYDNAAPLYRVLLSASGGQLVKLKLLNVPKDAMHWPLRNTVVELLPWAAALPNGERVGAVAGHLCKVAVSYNPDDQTLEIDTAVPAGFGTQWQSRSDAGDFFNGQPEDNFFYLRVWMRGDDTASPAAIPIANGNLGNTGLRVTFSGAPLRAADHWVIAARPAAPDVIVPWVLTEGTGMVPHGIARYRAPVGLIEWTTTGTTTTGTLISDCRPPFLPLTRLRGCCSVTVGDGTTSFGQYTSIQSAVDALPAAGGVVCILPGRYVEAVVIGQRRNVTLHGCGPRSRIVAPEVAGAGSTAVRIDECSDVAIETLALEGGSSPVVHVTTSAVVRVAECLVQMRDDRQRPSIWPAVFVQGAAIEIEHNIVEALPENLPLDLQRIFHRYAAPERARVADAARVGIQLAGGCEHVRVAGNVIVGGTGNGITLGSIVRIDEKNPDGTDIPDIDVFDPCAPCAPTDSGTPPDDPNNPVRYESGGDLYDIEIVDNVIDRHGANGISVVRFFSFDAKNARLALVGVHGLLIRHNEITRCLRREVAKPPQALLLFLAYGAITLALTSALEIEGNVIDGNGRDWLTPVCGVFVLAADGLRIEHNQITHNGVRSKEPLASAQNGLRAGVHVWLALTLGAGSKAGTASSSFSSSGKLVSGVLHRQRALPPQIRVHANQIEQPLGRALFMLGAGAMQITDNLLASRGTGRPATDAYATTVLVANLGISREWTLGLLLTLVYKLVLQIGGYAGSGAVQKLICTLSTLSVLTKPYRSVLPTGKTMFNDNQVSFDMTAAPTAFDIASTLLLSLDDISACDNQFEHHVDTRIVIADLVAAAPTVRTSDNRFAETWGRAVYSALSLGLLNTAADNQSTHCIKALGLRTAVHHNLTIAEVFCDDACSNDKRIANIAAAGRMAVQQKL